MRRAKTIPIQRKHQFGVTDLLGWVLFVSLIFGVLFSGSAGTMSICSISLFALVSLYCWRKKFRAEVSGALIGATGPALVAMLLVGELFIVPVPDVYAETEMNVLLAIAVVLFLVPIGTALGSAFLPLASMGLEVVSDYFRS